MMSKQEDTATVNSSEKIPSHPALSATDHRPGVSFTLMPPGFFNLFGHNKRGRGHVVARGKIEGKKKSEICPGFTLNKMEDLVQRINCLLRGEL